MNNAHSEFPMIESVKHELTGPLTDFVGLLDEYPPAEYIGSFDSNEIPSRYQHYPREALRFAREIEERHGRAALERYNRLVLVYLIEQFDKRFEMRSFPVSLRPAYEHAFKRILDQVDKGREGYYLPQSDGFCKDL